ncbi:DUF6151 family protein [Kordiimonas aquimaris]|uniref:DUF6151 family protein n=1 Tax=Kordiimonas aquimaris TaxID=707591 RepID=UPI0021D2ECCE|nr:DUF6151 family protein [Kordiimonas aquimaris]
MTDLNLECSCGSVKGVARDISPKTGIHVVCYCDDCQAFARELGQQNTILDRHGGTDIFQMSPATIEITTGTEHLCCMRLNPKGMHRWYTGCCKTPIGNTVNAKVPFIGFITTFFAKSNDKAAALGPISNQIMVKFSQPPLPNDLKVKSSKFVSGLRVLSKFIKWKIRDGSKPTPFFNKDGTPVATVGIVSKNTGINA